MTLGAFQTYVYMRNATRRHVDFQANQLIKSAANQTTLRVLDQVCSDYVFSQYLAIRSYLDESDELI